MKKKPVVIDMNIIINPYKMLSVIQGVDKIYSEIVIPFPLTHIEVWHPKWRQFTFHLFMDNSILSIDLESFFGLTDGITANNFISGIKLLIMAYKKGMVRVVDIDKSFAYKKLGKEILGISGSFDNTEKISLGNNNMCNINELYITPDLPVSEMLYGMQNDNMFAIYGNSNFLNYWYNENLTYYQKPKLQKTSFNSKIDGRLQTLLYLEKITNLSEAFEYVQAPNVLSKIDIELRNTIKDYQNKKNMFLITLEFVSTVAIDSMLGIPAATSTVFACRFVKKLISKQNSNIKVK